MATIDDHKQLIERIKLKLQQFLTIDLVSLTREIELGNQLSFKKGEEQAAVEVGVAQHYLIFKEESEEHKILSNIWLSRTVYVLIGIGVAGIALLFIPPHDTATISLIQFTVTKIVILSVLFYGLAICTRNYKAHKHNSILNKHRQNALNTFETFTKAAGNDTQTKSAVLLEATHTIFSNQQTGYLNNDNDSDSPNKIIEIFKNVSDKGQ